MPSNEMPSGKARAVFVTEFLDGLNGTWSRTAGGTRQPDLDQQGLWRGVVAALAGDWVSADDTDAYHASRRSPLRGEHKALESSPNPFDVESRSPLRGHDDFPESSSMKWTWFTWVSGADPELLRKVPSAKGRFVSLAMTVLATAVLAGVSGTIASVTAGFSLWFALPLGVGLALTIGVIDRAILNIPRRRGVFQSLVVALPRLLLALLVGVVLAEPLVLRIFSSEIQSMVGSNAGLLEQMEALNRLADDNPTFRLAYWSVTALLIAMQLLPSLIQILTSLGPPTSYDRLLEKSDQLAVDTATRERLILAEKHAALVAVVAERIASAEAEIYERAVDQWKAAILRHADVDLATLSEQPDMVIKIPRLTVASGSQR